LLAPVVIIEVASPAATPSSTAALVQACDEAVQQGHCALSEPGAEPLRPDAIAIVSWQMPNQAHVRVEVGVRGASGTQWAVRELDFRNEDSTIERWRSAGLVIATLVGSLTKQADRMPRAAEATRKGRTTSGWIGAGAEAGPAMEQGLWRPGLWVNGAWVLRPLPLYLGLTADYNLRGRDRHRVAAQWLTVGAGAGVFATSSFHLQVGVGAEAILEYLHVQALHPVTGTEAQQGNATPGFRATLDLSWPSDRGVCALGGVQWWRLRAGTTVRVADEAVDRSPPWGLKGLVGLRIRLP